MPLTVNYSKLPKLASWLPIWATKGILELPRVGHSFL